MKRGQRGRVLAGVAWMAAGLASAQVRSVPSQPAEVETTVAGALGRLAARAGLVFVGTVVSIDRTPGVVEISLRVEQVIQGQPGGLYVLREWAGRWPPGTHRYSVGQRSLFFLNAPGPSGLSAPVDGGEGVVPVLGDPAFGAVVDAQRLNATLLRSVGEKLSDVRTVSLQEAAQLVLDAGQTGLRRPANPSGEKPVPIDVQGKPTARSVGGSDGTR